MKTILIRMKALAEKNEETAHFEADKLLVETVRLLAKDKNASIAGEIINAYEVVGKWYS